MRCYGHMAHGTSLLYTSVRSLRDLHSLWPSALGCVNSVETCTSVYNLHIEDMVIFTALAKIYSTEYFYNTEVAGLGEIFVQEKFSAI